MINSHHITKVIADRVYEAVKLPVKWTGDHLRDAQEFNTILAGIYPILFFVTQSNVYSSLASMKFLTKSDHDIHMEIAIEIKDFVISTLKSSPYFKNCTGETCPILVSSFTNKKTTITHHLCNNLVAYYAYLFSPKASNGWAMDLHTLVSRLAGPLVKVGLSKTENKTHITTIV